jgi:LPXTG-motif cell wall-anchored protein
MYKWLEGATFKLMQTHEFKDADAASGSDTYGMNGAPVALATPKEILFDSNHIAVATGGSRPTSDANGYIPMKGLDAGVYELTEVAAPLGYSFDPSIVYVITITPEFTNDNETDETFTDVPNKILSGYTVSIDVKKGSTTLAQTETKYTSDTAGDPASPVSFINEGDNPTGGITVTEQDATTAEAALIVNKELGILPATGGSGILFYVFIGAAIMALAVILARKNRKANGMNAATA